jgi:hypothetical protein
MKNCLSMDILEPGRFTDNKETFIYRDLDGSCYELVKRDVLLCYCPKERERFPINEKP